MFSVIIPAYQAEEYLNKAMESVLRQTCPDFELIVVDDGSADRTAEVAAKYDDARIRYLYQENGGVSSARNTGIRHAEKPYVCFLDADDEWLPDHLETLQGLIAAYPDCRVFFTGHQIRLLSGELLPHTERLMKKVPDRCFRSENGYELLWKYGYVMHTNSVCCQRTMFEKVGFFEPGVTNGEDDDMWYRLLAYSPVGVSKNMTTIYNREYSRATARTNLVSDWVFLKRVDEIMASREIPAQRKAFLRKLLERKKLTRIRKAILAGEKRSAVGKLLKLDLSLIFGKKYLQTWFALLIPYRWLQEGVSLRDKGYFSQEREETRNKSEGQD